MLQCVAECSSVMQCVAVRCSVLQGVQNVAVCCSVLQGVAVCCSVLQCVAVCLQCVAVCCSVLQCLFSRKFLAFSRKELQCVAGVSVLRGYSSGVIKAPPLRPQHTR